MAPTIFKRTESFVDNISLRHTIFCTKTLGAQNFRLKWSWSRSFYRIFLYPILCTKKKIYIIFGWFFLDKRLRLFWTYQTNFIKTKQSLYNNYLDQNIYPKWEFDPRLFFKFSKLRRETNLNWFKILITLISFSITNFFHCASL